MTLSELDVRFAALLRDLALAWRQQATYPAGHPARAGGVRTTRESLDALLALTGPLEVGVLTDALMFQGERVTTPNAVRIATRLSEWHVALLAFEPGAGDDEVAALIGRLADDPRKASDQHFGDGLLGGTRGRIRVGEIDFTALSLVEPGADGRHGVGGRSVWQSVVATLLAGRILGGDEWSAWVGEGGDAEGVIGHLVGGGLAGGAEAMGAGAPGTDGTGLGGPGLGGPGLGGPGSGGPAAGRDAAASAGVTAAMAAAPGTATRATAAGRVVARAWLAADAAERAATAPQVARILSRLPREVRGPLIEQLARRAAKMDPEGTEAAALVSALPTEEAVAALRKLAGEPGGLTARLAELAQELGLAGRAVVGASAVELLGELRGLFGDGDVDVPGLGRPVGAREPELPAWDPAFRFEDPSLAPLAEALSEETPLVHVAHTTLELLADVDDPDALAPLVERLESAFRELVLGGRLRSAIDLVARLRRAIDDPDRPEPSRQTLRAGLERMASREGISALVEILGELSGDADEQALRLVEALGGHAVHGLLVALAEEEGRSRRHGLVTFLAKLGDKVVPDATLLLRDSRWYVVRNMLLLLRQLDDRTSLPEVRRLAGHSDLRVKLEAIRSLFALDRRPPTDLLAAIIHDPDPKLAETAVTLAGTRGFVEAVAPLADLVRPWDPFGRRRSVRLRALKALGQIGAPTALQLLDRFSRRWGIFPIAPEERRAYFHSLAGYPPEARAPYVARGLAFPDPEIQATCRRLAASGENR